MEASEIKGAGDVFLAMIGDRSGRVAQIPVTFEHWNYNKCQVRDFRGTLMRDDIPANFSRHYDDCLKGPECMCEARMREGIVK